MASLTSRLKEPLDPSVAARIRLHLALIPVYGWAILAWSVFAADNASAGRLDRAGHIKGHDFVHFYVLGQIGLDRATGDLYSYAAQSARTDLLLPEYEARFLPVHTPQVAMFFAPFAALPYEQAVITFLALSWVAYAGTCAWLWRRLVPLHGFGLATLLLCAAFPPLIAVSVAGQTSTLALAWFALAYLGLRADRRWLAGLALGMLAYKPTLGLGIAVVFLWTRQGRIIGGAVTAALAQGILAWLYFGNEAIAGYFTNFATVLRSVPMLEARPDIMHSLRSLFSFLLPWPAAAVIAYAVVSGIVLVLAIRVWRSPSPLELRYGALMIASLLVNPHVYSYELVVLALPFLLIAAWALESRLRSPAFWLLGYACFLLPALDVFTIVTRVQWSVVALLALMIALTRAALQPSSRAQSDR
jgi:hypothetical protein